MSLPALGLLAALALTSLTTSAAAAHSGLETLVQDDARLLHRSPAQVGQAMAQLGALGVDRVRLTASWQQLTRNPDSPRRPSFDASDPAAYEQNRWRELDVAVTSARAAGLKVLIDVGFWAPRWAGRGPGPRVRTAIDVRQYADFGVAIARRYSGHFSVPVPAAPPPAPPMPGPPSSGGPAAGGGGPLSGLGGVGPLSGSPWAASRSQARAWTSVAAAQMTSAAPSRATGPLPSVDMLVLWNEPNHPAFLEPQWTGDRAHRRPVSTDQYRSMVLAAYPAIKRQRPDVTVLIGNTSSRGGFGGHDPVPPLRFLRALACVDDHLRPLQQGSCAHFHRLPGDGWAHHPYTLTGTPAQTSSGRRSDDIFLADLPRLAHTLDRLVAMGRLAPAMRSIYITEYGYETTPLAGRRNVSEATQARYLTWGEYLASRVPNVRAFAQFLLRDQPPAATVQSDSLRRPFGQFYTGLEHADGRPKLAARSFVAGLFVARHRASSVLLFGRLRLAGPSRTVEIQIREPHQSWMTLSTERRPGVGGASSFVIGGHDNFTRYGPYRPGAVYRLAILNARRWYPSLSVPVVSTGR